jgi:hypothetical protein
MSDRTKWALSLLSAIAIGILIGQLFACVATPPSEPAKVTSTPTVKPALGKLEPLTLPPVLDRHGKEIKIVIAPCPMCFKVFIEGEWHTCRGFGKTYKDGRWHCDGKAQGTY